VYLPFLSPVARIDILRLELSRLGVPLADHTDNGDVTRIASEMEGYRAGDIIIVAKRVLAVVAKRMLSSSSSSSSSPTASTDDVRGALVGFIPSSVTISINETPKIAWNKIGNLSSSQSSSSSLSSSASFLSSSSSSLSTIGGMRVAKEMVTSVFRLPLMYRRLFSSAAGTLSLSSSSSSYFSLYRH